MQYIRTCLEWTPCVKLYLFNLLHMVMGKMHRQQCLSQWGSMGRLVGALTMTPGCRAHHHNHEVMRTVCFTWLWLVIFLYTALSMALHFHSKKNTSTSWWKCSCHYTRSKHWACTIHRLDFFTLWFMRTFKGSLSVASKLVYFWK